MYLLAMSRWVSRPCLQSMRISSMVDLLSGFPIDTATPYFLPFLAGLGVGFFLVVISVSVKPRRSGRGGKETVYTPPPV